MKVLIGTPAAGGQLTTQYALSFLQASHDAVKHKQEIGQKIIQSHPGYDPNNLEHINGMQQALHQHSYDLSLYTLAGESLIQRGRNHIAQVALTGGFDKLLFIDADAGFTWAQMKKIIDSPHPVIAGLCPLKIYPITLNYLPFQDDEAFFDHGVRSLEGTKKMVEKHKNSVVKVPFVGTAFMCIAREVLMKLAETSDHYFYPNPYTGQTQSHWDFFKVESINSTYLSEDWGFCHKARKAGYDIMIDTDVIITHTGNHTFRV